MRRTIIAAAALSLLWGTPALADYFIRDGNNNLQTVKAFGCGGASICPGYVPMDLGANQFGVANNPFFVAPVQDVRPVAGSVNIIDSGSTTTTGQNGVSIITGSPTAGSSFAQAINGQGTARVQLSGTWTGTVAFEGSIDSGTTWVAQPARVTGTAYSGSSATAKGMFLIDTSGLTNLRVRATAAITGTVSVLFTFANNDGLVQVANPVRLVDNASGFLATITSGGALNVNCATGCSGGGGGGGAVTMASGAVASGAYSSGSLAVGAGADGWDSTQGAISDAAATVGGAGSVSAKLRLLTTLLNSVNLGAVGGTALTAPTSYGTAPSGNVIGVNAFVTNTNTNGQKTMANSSPVVIASDQSAVPASQSGTWTVQPGNTANTTPWLATINQGGNSATVTGSNALKVDGSAVTQPVSGTVTANTTSASNVTLTACSGSITTGGTAQNAFSAASTRHGFTIANIDTTEVLWISFTTTAAASGTDSFPLAPATATTFASLSSFTSPPGMGINTALSVIAATTSHKFSCTVW